MQIEYLIANLQNPQPQVRMDVVRVLGMVEETLALDALRKRYEEESLPDLKQTVLWAGRRIYAAQQRGFNTHDHVLHYFGVVREVEQMEDETEAELLKRMEQELHLEMIRRQRDATRTKNNMTAGVLAATAALGMAGLPVGGVSPGSLLQAGAEVASSNLGVNRPQIGRQRTPAMRPTNTDITVWLKKLANSADRKACIDACRQLVELNNPAALPHLARVFVSTDDPEIRQAAEEAGKRLYWNSIYWQMEQDGTLAEDIELLKKMMGKTSRTRSTERPPASPDSADAAPSSPPQEDLNEILRRAEEARAKRRRQQGL
ncbi:MAG: hypothetical protein Kow0077_10520 [Anaerolineae bacterium]